MEVCPKCKKKFDRLLALSRIDNKTMICDDCGTREALDAVGLTEGSSVREAIMSAKQTPYERTRQQVYASGNKWAIANFNATHN